MNNDSIKFVSGLAELAEAGTLEVDTDSVEDGELAAGLNVVDMEGVGVNAVDGVLAVEEGSAATEVDMDKEVVVMGKGVGDMEVVEDIKKKNFFAFCF